MWSDGKDMTTTQRATYIVGTTTLFTFGPAMIAPLALAIGPAGMVAIAAILLAAAFLI